MKKRIVIEYDVINNAVSIPENDMTTFEAFGMLEAAKQMITEKWLKNDGEE